jgi:hypothetical protein
MERTLLVDTIFFIAVRCSRAASCPLSPCPSRPSDTAGFTVMVGHADEDGSSSDMLMTCAAAGNNSLYCLRI